MKEPTITELHSRVAVCARRLGPDADATWFARRDLAVGLLAREISRRLANCPPLTAAQVEGLTARLQRAGGVS